MIRTILIWFLHFWFGLHNSTLIIVMRTCDMLLIVPHLSLFNPILSFSSNLTPYHPLFIFWLDGRSKNHLKEIVIFQKCPLGISNGFISSYFTLPLSKRLLFLALKSRKFGDRVWRAMLYYQQGISSFMQQTRMANCKCFIKY